MSQIELGKREKEGKKWQWLIINLSESPAMNATLLGNI